MAKAADRLYAMALTVLTVEQRTVPHSDLQQEVGEDGLLVLLDGNSGLRAGVRLDPGLMTALIEVQTTGHVRSGDAESRPATQTDAAIIAPMIDAVLSGFAEQMAAAAPNQIVPDYRFGDRIEGARLLSLAMEAPEYELFRINLDIENGTRDGLVVLAFPQEVLTALGSTDDHNDGAPRFTLEDMALTAPVTLDVVVARLTLPLHEVSAFAVGMTLPVGKGSLEDTLLLASKGHKVAKVKLGQLNGFRAVRLCAPHPHASNKTELGPGNPGETEVVKPVGGLSTDWQSISSPSAEQVFADQSFIEEDTATDLPRSEEELVSLPQAATKNLIEPGNSDDQEHLQVGEFSS